MSKFRRPILSDRIVRLNDVLSLSLQIRKTKMRHKQSNSKIVKNMHKLYVNLFYQFLCQILPYQHSNYWDEILAYMRRRTILDFFAKGLKIKHVKINYSLYHLQDNHEKFPEFVQINRLTNYLERSERSREADRGTNLLSSASRFALRNNRTNRSLLVTGSKGLKYDPEQIGNKQNFF